MSDDFDAYREALVMETDTFWPEEYSDLGDEQRAEIEGRLHADAESCADIEYVRVHTGFCRVINATADDIERVSS